MVRRVIYACRWLAIVTLICAALATPAAAHREVQEWHGFGMPAAASVDSTDGSVWAAIGTRVYHLSTTGTVLAYAQLYWPSQVAASPFDGSCWALDRVPTEGADSYALVQVSAEGTVLCRLDGMAGDAALALAPSVSPNDGTCWIAWTDVTYQAHLARLRPGGQVMTQLDGGEGISCIGVSALDNTVWVGRGRYLTHLDVSGAEVFRSAWFPDLTAIAVDPADGSVWVAEGQAFEVAHFAADGQELWRGRPWGDDPALWPGLSAVAVDTTDGSCWVAGPDLVRLSAAGEVVARVDPLDVVHTISCNTADGSLWVVGFTWNYEGDVPIVGTCLGLYHFDRAGAMLAATWPEIEPVALAADMGDESCWLLDANALVPPPDTPIVHISSAGAVLGRTGATLGGLFPQFLAVSPQDGSFWVALAAADSSIFARLNAAGEEVVRKVVPFPYDPYPGSGYRGIASLALDPGDGSCWAAINDYDNRNSEIFHFAADGTQRFHEFWPCGVSNLCVSARDGSVWVANEDSGRLTHLSRQGTVLSAADIPGAHGTATNARDGSVWVSGGTEEGEDQLLLLAADGEVRWQLPQEKAWGLAVDPATGFCWAARGGSLAIYGCAGQELWRSSYAVMPLDSLIAVDPATGTCWVLLEGNEVARLRVPLTPFGDVAFSNWAIDEISACVEAGIVQGYPYGIYTVYHPGQAVTRDQMAVYLARAFAGGDGNVQVPSGVTQPTFPDIAADHWAYRYIEYCAGEDLVQGYPGGGYQPNLVVTRDQMAVYIARALVGGDAFVPTGPAEASFSDVDIDHWAYDYISYCHAQGIVQGYDNGTYRPDAEVTRDQMAVYVARAFELSLESPAEESARLGGPFGG